MNNGGQKLRGTIVAVLLATPVFYIGWRAELQQDQLLGVAATVWFIATIGSSTFWTLLARSTVGGFILNILAQFFVVIYGGSLTLLFLGPKPSPTAMITTLLIDSFAA